MLVWLRLVEMARLRWVIMTRHACLPMKDTKIGISLKKPTEGNRRRKVLKWYNGADKDDVE